MFWHHPVAPDRGAAQGIWHQMKATFPIDQAARLPRWQRPEAMLLVMQAGVLFTLSVWTVLINNFVVEIASFDGRDIGWLQTVREVPGFLAFLVVLLLGFMREQTLALIAAALLGAMTMLVSEFPSFWGLLFTTLATSTGFHYFETAAQSLQLQWLDKTRAPQVLGWIVAAGSVGSLIAYAGVAIGTEWLGLGYRTLYWAGGIGGVICALWCWLAYPKFEGHTVQRRGYVLRRRYWLYYALVFISGARRQIFVVFAAFMMVDKFGLSIYGMAWLFTINYVANMFFAPMVGRLIHRHGERRALIAEYGGLIVIFMMYIGIYHFGWGWQVAAGLYVIDHLFFAMAFAQKTYFQKIADPADQAPTAAVAFTINHIAAVFLPATLGYLWMVAPSAVFGLAVAMSCISLAFALLVPRHPREGRETVLARVPAATPAE